MQSSLCATRRAGAFGMEVCAIRRQAQGVQPEELAFLGGPEQLDEVLQRSDYLAITLSLSPATRNLIGERELRLMKPSAFLINVARAEIIAQQVLYEALASKWIAGAALDVWYRYPTTQGSFLPSDYPFHELDRGHRAERRSTSLDVSASHRVITGVSDIGNVCMQSSTAPRTSSTTGATVPE
jgi:phosphoglycerate dehydrogenase-like enzyme